MGQIRRMADLQIFLHRPDSAGGVLMSRREKALLVIGFGLGVFFTAFVVLIDLAHAEPLAPVSFSVDTVLTVNQPKLVWDDIIEIDTTFDTTFSFALCKANPDPLDTNPVVPNLVDTITIDGRRFELREVE